MSSRHRSRPWLVWWGASALAGALAAGVAAVDVSTRSPGGGLWEIVSAIGGYALAWFVIGVFTYLADRRR